MGSRAWIGVDETMMMKVVHRGCRGRQVVARDKRGAETVEKIVRRAREYCAEWAEKRAFLVLSQEDDDRRG